MTTLDAIDQHILLELQLDGRLTNQELADRVGLSPSPCLRRVRALEQAGIITGYRAVVAPESVGLAITAFVRLTLSSHTAEVVDAVEQELREVPEITEAYLLAGDQDYLVKVVVESFAAYEQFLRDRLRGIPSLASIETTFAFGTTKPVSPLALP
ncbi:Lrp/AsnC family transcriptional regulator [Nocardioides sp. R1-1]|uniref:Lrp/AsnC family transcriptional regulator n=1 Tax=Nocardioides sp. R1-1 TaxID=3383502 RepID=UPI0038D0B8A9